MGTLEEEGTEVGEWVDWDWERGRVEGDKQVVEGKKDGEGLKIEGVERGEVVAEEEDTEVEGWDEEPEGNTEKGKVSSSKRTWRLINALLVLGSK